MTRAKHMVIGGEEREISTEKEIIKTVQKYKYLDMILTSDGRNR